MKNEKGQTWETFFLQLAGIRRDEEKT